MDTVGRDRAATSSRDRARGRARTTRAVIAARMQRALGRPGARIRGRRRVPDRRRRPRRASALGRRQALRGQARTRAAPKRIKMTAKELSWATALARAVDERMAVQHEHSWKVAEYCVGDRRAARLDGARPRAAADGGRSSTTSARCRSRTTSCASAAADRQEWEAIKQNPVRGAEMVVAHPGARDDRARGSVTRSSASTAPAIRTG